MSAIFWLRWKLWRRRWHRQGPLLRALGVLGTIIAIPLCALSFFLALGLGVVVLPTASPTFVAVIWLVSLSLFIYLRIMGLWFSLQQDDGLAFDRLLHLPIAFRTVFYINFVLSQVSFANLFFLPMFLGFAIASAIVLPLGNLVLVPAVLAFALCVGAILHQFHNWLLLSMVNKRTRMVWAYLLFVCVIVAAQLPNLYFVLSQKPVNTERTQTQTELIVAEIVNEHSVNEEENSRDSVVEENEVTSDHWSSSWVLNGKPNESTVPWWSAALSVGLLGLVLLSLRRSYRSTLIRYRDGQDVSKKTAIKNTSERRSARGSRIARSPTYAVVNITIKSWLRSAYGKMVLLSPLILLMLIPLVLLRYPALFEPSWLPLVLIGAVAFIGAPVGLVCNLFAFDRLGFRLYLFAGINLKYVLLGKFVALSMVFSVICILVFALAVTMTSISLFHLLGTVFQTGLVFICCCVVGVILSARYPYAVSFTSMKAHGGAANALAVLAELILMGLVISIASYVLAMDDAVGEIFGVSTYFLVSLLEFIVALVVAGLLLKPLANYVTRRSNHILEAVAIEN
ncbi:MAG: hypothetical protein OXG15_11430 [Gammaproteobacteria bacterium]|nr:hypothetical protein [Gammaproteobacteria bacterium]